jgi:hypothetical protein
VELIGRRARKDGVTVVLVTHDNRILDVADRILALEDGRLSSLMSAVTVDTQRLMRTLGQEIRKGELVRHVQGMNEQAFVALLEGVTAETEDLLEVVNTLQSDAFVSMLGQLLEAFSSKLAQILRAEHARILFLDEGSGEPWSLGRCETGRYGEVQVPSREDSGTEPSGGPALRRAVQDSRGRTFAVVEVERARHGSAFAVSDERRLGEVTASLGTLLESWWRMGCGCRAGMVLRPVFREGARSEDGLGSS